MFHCTYPVAVTHGTGTTENYPLELFSVHIESIHCCSCPLLLFFFSVEAIFEFFRTRGHIVLSGIEITVTVSARIGKYYTTLHSMRIIMIVISENF